MNRKEFAARFDALLDELAKAGIGVAVLDRRDDCYYYTGYTGSDAVALFHVKSRKGWLITDARYTEEAAKTARGFETTLWKRNFPAFTGDLLRKLKAKKVAYTPTSMTAAFFDAMRGTAPGVSEWVRIEEIIASQRAVKSRAEIAAMQAALACAEAAFLAAKTHWKAGMTETEVKNDLEWEMRKQGAQDTAFETIVAVGPNASLPHAHAGERGIQAGKMLLIDFGARLNRYNSDLTRTLWAGSVPAVWRKRYETVLAAQRAGIAAIAEGVDGLIPHQEAVAVFAKAGIQDKFTHGLGHGVGLAVHEEPRLSPAYARRLRAGNIVTVEPGVYFPGAGGIRVEDMMAVEKGGCRVLSSLAKDLEAMVF